MMECRQATDLMLEAELAELQSDGEGVLAAHLRTCAGCRARADLILAQQTRLDAALTSLSGGAPRIPQPVRVSHRRWPRLVLPLAAAAAAALVVWQTTSEQTDRLPPILLPATRVAEVPVVNTRGVGNVAVMGTADPKITVVWYY